MVICTNMGLSALSLCCVSEGRDYIVTIHTWSEFERILRRKHKDQSWEVYATEVHADSPGKAKARFMRFNELDSVKFVDLKCKLRKNVCLNPLGLRWQM